MPGGWITTERTALEPISLFVLPKRETVSNCQREKALPFTGSVSSISGAKYRMALSSSSAGAPRLLAQCSTSFRQCACRVAISAGVSGSGAKTPSNTGLGTPKRQIADGNKTTGGGECHHQRLSLYGRLKPFLSFRKRKERNGFKKRSLNLKRFRPNSGNYRSR